MKADESNWWPRDDSQFSRFLLAHLQLQHLCTLSSVKKVRQSLGTLAGNVNEFYTEALKRIENQGDDDKELVKKALSFIFHAKRPLTVMELLHALSVELGESCFDDTGLPEKQILLSVTAGLIRIDDNDNTGLVHLTFYELLAGHPGLFLESEPQFGLVCVTYLSFEDFATGPCTTAEHLEQRLRQYNFLTYASLHWSYHLMENVDQEAIDLTLKFLGDKRKVNSSLQVLHIPRHRTTEWYDCTGLLRRATRRLHLRFSATGRTQILGIATETPRCTGRFPTRLSHASFSPRLTAQRHKSC